MLVKYPNKRNAIEFVSLEGIVLGDHLLRKTDAAIDFDKIYDFVKVLYCKDNVRPSVDPVVLFKIVLIQHIYAIPHFSIISHNFKHRFSQKTIEYVFRWILNTAAEEGYLNTEAVFS